MLQLFTVIERSGPFSIATVDHSKADCIVLVITIRQVFSFEHGWVASDWLLAGAWLKVSGCM